MSAPEVEQLRRRLLSIVRVTNRLRDNSADLHTLGWDPHIGDKEPDRGQFESRAPRTGDRRAQALYARLAAEADAIEAILVGLDRAAAALFWARSTNPEPSRGSLISRLEHDQLLARQRTRARTGEYTPAPLIDQPTHPGKKP